jgi:mannose-6-phosphate isomerase
MLYPYRFTPLLMERVWGGRALARFGKSLPPDKLIGESWEISDRDDAQSVVANGPDKGKTLHQLITAPGYKTIVGGHGGVSHAALPTAPVERGGPTAPQSRFPLLIKLLDARERLSLQVHPPAAVAAKLDGEPKTEIWYIMDAATDAHLIAGLRRGVTRADFERALRGSSEPLADLVHRIPVSKGDALFVPSGRLHAIDAGLVIAEIQQNSDTTYRVFDWNRVGLNGKPRPLHVKESLASINFRDFEPAKAAPRIENIGANSLRRLLECDCFHVHELTLREPQPEVCDGSSFHIIGCVEGALAIRCTGLPEERLAMGEFALLPAALGPYTLVPAAPGAKALKITVPPPSS